MKQRKFFVLLFVLLVSIVCFSCEPEDTNPVATDSTVKISIPSTRIDWGTIAYGQAFDKTFSFTCDPSSGDKLRGTVSIDGNGFVLVNGSGTYAIAAGATRSIKVRFIPDRKGSFTGSLSIVHNAENKATPITIILSGTAN